MVVVVAYWLVSRHWCRYPRNRWILHFRLDPFFLPTGDAAKNASLYRDVPTQLLDTALSTKTTAFAGVRWVLEGFMRALKNESDEGRKTKTIKSFKMFGAAGASTSAECVECAKRVDLPVRTCKILFEA